MARPTALAEAMKSLDVRFGARTVATATSAAERAARRRFATGTSFDRLAGGIAPGSITALVGEGTCGKVSLALRAAAGAQQAGGMVMWVDGASSFDPLAARRAGVDLSRLTVVRTRSAGEVVLAAGAALRSGGFRLVAVDLGPSFAQVASPDQLAPLLPSARGSTSALVVVSETPARRASLPTFVFERLGWEQRHGRTSGWTFEVRGLEDDERVVMARAV